MWVLCVLVFVNKYRSKEHKNVVEFKEVGPEDSDTTAKRGIGNDGKKKIDLLEQATSWHIEASKKSMFKQDLLTLWRFSDFSIFGQDPSEIFLPLFILFSIHL